jgi:hypothetical protein
MSEALPQAGGALPAKGAPDVPYANRYTAAWGEISQRIALRQQVYLHFATVSMTAIVAVIGVWAKGGEPAFRAVAECGAVALVVYSWAFALWIRNNHDMVGLLGVYCKMLEGGFKKDRKPEEICPHEAWHTEDAGWIVLSRHYGRFSDFAAVMLALTSAAPALYFGAVHYLAGGLSRAAAMFILGLVGMASAVFVGVNPIVRRKIGGYDPDIVEEKGNRLRSRRSP